MLDTEKFHDQTYRALGFQAQRRYPNEEMLRFMGRKLFPIRKELRRQIDVLEVGCGSGANLWAIAREGFRTCGLDLSAEGVKLCRQMLTSWGYDAELHVGDMAALDFADGRFTAVLDVFSSYCLTEAVFQTYLAGVARVLKPGGLYFSYTPSKNSDVFKQAGPADKLDASTLDGIRRPDAPFSGNLYPFRFISPDEYAAQLDQAGFDVEYCETLGRTYRNGAEYFEFVVIQGVKR